MCVFTGLLDNFPFLFLSSAGNVENKQYISGMTRVWAFALVSPGFKSPFFYSSVIWHLANFNLFESQFPHLHSRGTNIYFTEWIQVSRWCKAHDSTFFFLFFSSKKHLCQPGLQSYLVALLKRYPLVNQLLWMLAEFSSSRAGGLRVISWPLAGGTLGSSPHGCLYRAAHSMVAGFPQSKQVREQQRVSKMEARVFCNFISEAISHHCSLAAHTLRKGLHKGVNARRCSCLGGRLPQSEITSSSHMSPCFSSLQRQH